MGALFALRIIGHAIEPLRWYSALGAQVVAACLRDARLELDRLGQARRACACACTRLGRAVAIAACERRACVAEIRARGGEVRGAIRIELTRRRRCPRGGIARSLVSTPSSWRRSNARMRPFARGSATHSSSDAGSRIRDLGFARPSSITPR